MDGRPRFIEYLEDNPLKLATLSGLLIIILSLILLYIGLIPYTRHHATLESPNYPYDTINTGLLTYSMGSGIYTFNVRSSTAMNITAGCIDGDSRLKPIINKTLEGYSGESFSIECDVIAYLYYRAHIPSGTIKFGDVGVVKRWP